jgi:EAL domain-containing protein (putative c-di-GMP-specific phosphodiesterase class I)/GGDEF domain-containing protein
MNQLRIVVMDSTPPLVEDHDTALRQLGLIDQRTGLPHRDLLIDRLGQTTAGVARGGSAFALMVLGTAALPGAPADQPMEPLLEAFARQLHRLSRRTDSFARLTADEFAALLPGNPSVAGLMAMGQKIASEFADRLQIHIGVALCPRHASDPDTLMQQARAARAQARAAQVVTALYEPRSPIGPATPATESVDDPAAPLFQPVIDLHTGAPMRLQITTTTLTAAPSDFAPTGLNGATGTRAPRQAARQQQWLDTLDAALRRAGPWRQQGLVQHLSMPLPGRLLADAALVPALLRRLESHRWPASHLMIEAHAAAIAQHGGAFIDALAGTGLALALNDAQAGLSLHLALAGIEPVAELKFDARVLDGLPRPEQRAAIVRAQVALARGWGARVVADHVDDPTTLAWLGEQGCDGVQGLASGRPLPADQVPGWCAAGRHGRAGSAGSAVETRVRPARAG